MYCKRCGAPIEDDEDKCSYCGRRVDREKGKEPPQKQIEPIQKNDNAHKGRGCLFLVTIGIIVIVIIILNAITYCN